MADVDIVLQVATRGVEDVYSLSNALKQLNRTVDGAVRPMRNLDNHAKALSRAMGSVGSSLNNHAKSLTQLRTNYSVLSAELGRVNKELKNTAYSYRYSSQASSAWNKQVVSDLRGYENALKKARARVLIEDLRSIAQEQKRLGKDAQFVGRSLIIGLTTPIMMFGRKGLESLIAVDTELVRLNKVLESVAPNTEAAAKKIGIDLGNATSGQKDRITKLVDSYKELEKGLTDTSIKFGIAKSLTVGLAADFAELGIQSTKNIQKLTDLTAATEKLGNMDISAAKDLVQSLYFQANRALMMSNATLRLSPFEREERAIRAATAQLYLFNVVENTTALTLRDLGDAFPEVAAAATSFGLSMTETAAMLAPMKAAGFEVGASANSIKVSLQRLTAPTKQNSEMFKSLTKELGFNFNLIKGTGLDAIQQLIDAYNKLTEPGAKAGQEGVLEFFAKVFGVRQGPRMEVAIAQLANFDKILKDTSANSKLAEKQIQNIANTTIAAAKANIPFVNSFKDIGTIARIATGEVGDQVEGMSGRITADQIKAAKAIRKSIGEQLADITKATGEDLIGQVGTEAGRAMFVQLAGPQAAQAVANRELEASLSSLDSTIQRVKNIFKLFASEIIKNLRPALESLSAKVQKLYKSWMGMSEETRARITKFITAILALVAAIGPLVFIFGQFRLAMGTVGKAMFSFLPSLKTMSVESVAASSGLLRLKTPLTVVGDTVYNTNSKFATFLGTLANTDTRVGRLANKIGILTGKLLPTTTAPAALQRQIAAQLPLRPGYTEVEGTAGIQAVQRQNLIRKGRSIVQRGGGAADTTQAALFKLEEQSIMRAAGIRESGGAYSRLPGSFRFGRSRVPRAVLADAVSIRQQAFERAGIARDVATGGLTRKGRAISEARALSISRGGAVGSVTKVYDNIGNKISNTINKLNSIPSVTRSSLAKANAAALKAQSDLVASSLALKNKAPSTFATLITGVKAYAKSFTLVDRAIKITKITLIASGIGAVILAIGVAIMLVKNNMDKFKSSASSGLGAIKDGINILKTTFKMLIQPIIDLFATFGNGSKDTEGAVEGISNAFNGIAKVFKKVASIIQSIVKNIIRPWLYAIVNIVGAIVSAFQGDWGKVFDYLKAGAAFAAEALINIIGAALKGIVKIAVEAAKIMLEVILSPITGALKLLSYIPGVGPKINNAYRTVVNSTKTAFNKIGDSFNKTIDSGAKSVKNLFKGMKDSGIKPGVGLGKGLGKGGKPPKVPKPDTEEFQEEIADATGEGMSEGAEEGSKKIASRIRELRAEIIDEIMKRAKDAIESIANSLEAALRKQKDKSIAVFDQQLETIAKLKKAEESLTRKKEYEANRRALIDERNLNREAYIRNRAFAIYEGRADDALALDIENRKSELQSKQKIEELDQRRTKDLADENLEMLKDQINESKKTAEKLFEDQIENFKKAAAKILEFGPTTAQEFNNQMQQLRQAAERAGLNIGDAFTTTLNSMNSNITNILANRTAPLFGESLGVIVQYARDVYGLGTSSGDDRSVIGSTLLLLSGITQAFTGDTTVGAAFSELTNGLVTRMQDLSQNLQQPLVEVMDSISTVILANNPFGENGVWQRIINEALDALIAKYSGAINAFNLVLDTANAKFQELQRLYLEYKNLTEGGDSTGGGGGGAGGDTTGGGGTGGTGGGALRRRKSGKKPEKMDVEPMRGGMKELLKLKTKPRQIYTSIQDALDVVINKHYGNVSQEEKKKIKTAGVDFFRSAKKTAGGSSDRSIAELTSRFKIKHPDWNSNMTIVRALYAATEVANQKDFGVVDKNYFRFYKAGGPVFGPLSSQIPAILHGGEYVVNANAVRNVGLMTLNAINNSRLQPPTTTGTYSDGSNSTSTVHIYVDNFIGEKAWFESMMKEYNINVAPKNAKAAGTETRIVSTYNGLNRRI